jgi:hypothetical protein
LRENEKKKVLKKGKGEIFVFFFLNFLFERKKKVAGKGKKKEKSGGKVRKSGVEGVEKTSGVQWDFKQLWCCFCFVF